MKTERDYHILVIEDSATIAAVVGEAMSLKNISCDYAGSAEEGLDTVHQAADSDEAKNYDALLVDWHLPDHKGIYIVKKLQSEYGASTPPIMIYSEHMEEEAYSLCAENESLVDLQFKSDLQHLPERMLKFLMLKDVDISDGSLLAESAAKVEILLVDDSETQRHKYSSVLREQGYQVFEAGSVKKGMEVALDNSILVAIVDYMMPDETGDVLVRKLRANNETKNCIVVMHSSRNDIQEAALIAGARDLLYKDDPINIFILRVRAIVQGAMARNQNQELRFFQQISEQMNIGFLKSLGSGYQPANRIMESILKDCPDLFVTISKLDEKEGHQVFEIKEKNNRSRSFIYSQFTLDDGGQAILLQDNTLLAEKTRKLEKANKKLQHQALYDPLTQLANRALFNAQFIKSINLANRTNSKIALLCIDLDRFKYVNDSLGHDAGDHLLSKVAKRLESECRSSDTVARMGGDEFNVVLTTDIYCSDDCEVAADKIIRALSQPFQLEQGTVQIGASIGITIYPEDGVNIETLLGNADTALYLAKESGRDNYQFFTEELNCKKNRRQSLELAMRKALVNKEFYLCYQPRVEFSTGNICGLEVLMRCKSAALGEVYPDEFIPILEETRLIFPIFEWLLDEACENFKRWRHLLSEPALLAVNLSPRQFDQQKNLVEIIEKAAAKHQLPNSCIDIEITESLFILDNEKILQILEQLGDMGCVITLDDFGTGYASLGYLKQFPIDVLKIDRLFVKDLPEAKDDEQLIDVILGIVKTMNMKAIIEGIETEDQLNLLAKKGCDSYQGYYFSKPITADAIDAMLNSIEPPDGKA